MRIFFSAGEPSGDLHGANLLRELKRLEPTVEAVGFGCERLAAAGQKQLFPMRELAVMGLLPVLAKLPTFVQLLRQADSFLARERPDAVVLIDYPGFNWWVARRAHARGIPVYYFVPPQIWAWAQWRVKKMRRFVDHVMCNLPFEETWYSERGVNAHYVGHPYYDALTQQRLDAAFLAEQGQNRNTVVGLLPGSRTQEVERNFPSMLRAAAIIHQARPDTRFLVAAFKETHRQRLNDQLKASALPIQTFVGRTPEIISLSKLCLAVSGSVSLELLWHGTPAIVVYRVPWITDKTIRPLVKVPYISLVNLMLDKALWPEFPTYQCMGEAVAEKALHWLNDTEAFAELTREMAELKERVAQPGACRRMAEFLVDGLAAEKLPSEVHGEAA